MKFSPKSLLPALLGASSCFFLSQQQQQPILLLANAFVVRPTTTTKQASYSSLQAEIRPETEKSKVLRFGWDGTTALGGAVEKAAPTRMLQDILQAGEAIPEECELFNANLEMTNNEQSEIRFEDVIELIDKYYETGPIEFQNGDMVNAPGQNEGSAKILSYAALCQLDQETTLKLFGQYYLETLQDPDGTSHANIRNFMKYGWEKVPFENGIALTRKNTGENEWDRDAESWIP